ncbi:MAG: hypothetical protein R3288_06770 [Woeseiaceae bacterium]|nr:hypothetical protein [Woeseiaceae bacterium]
MADRQTTAGVYEFVFGALAGERDALLGFWEVLGFRPTAEGSMTPQQAQDAYGHRSALTGIRLEHSGCRTWGTGHVRLQLWDKLAGDGLGNARPIVVGSRWMGLYTHDILQVRDGFDNAQARGDWHLWMSPLVNAPLARPAPAVTYFEPFVGLRETLVFGDRFRLAFIQRGGFDRPGFGTFDDTLPFKNTEGSHANIVQPEFDTDFYKLAFGFETAPYGEAHDSGDEPPTIAALNLKKGETFRVERTRAIDCPSGLLQVYSSYLAGDDLREQSRPGCGNLCAYSVRIRDLSQLSDVIESSRGAMQRGQFTDEFGNAALTFHAPDGYAWIAVADVA